MKQTAVVIAPGRGTYNKAELGYLKTRHPKKSDLIQQFDNYRDATGQVSVSSLDGMERYSISTHTRGDNASPLIYACAYSDFVSIDRKAFDIIGVTGNSMGWYIALACAGALSPMAGFEVVNTMGTLMQDHLIGGQIIYPYTDTNWVEIPAGKKRLLGLCHDISSRPDHFLAPSIDLGGLLVLAGDVNGLSAFEAEVEPVQNRFPMRLQNHAGFHSELQKPVSDLGKERLKPSLFQQPNLPLIDGRGDLWYPSACDLNALWDYTLGHQVHETYDFAAAIRIAAREFCPDVFIVLGPGTTLGGSVAQSLIRCDWQGWSDKASFRQAQNEQQSLISMGA